MAVREIVLYANNPAPLRKKCKPSQGVNRHTRKLIQDLKDTLNAHPDGIGLAAPQIDVHFRVVVVRLGSRSSDEPDHEPGPPLALVNPKLVEADDEQRDFDGCLSFPGLYAETVRPHRLRVKGLDEEGKPFDRLFLGFDAVVVHHEMDHLDGVLFIDRVERIEDLYRLQKDEDGRYRRVSLTPSQS